MVPQPENDTATKAGMALLVLLVGVLGWLANWISDHPRLTRIILATLFLTGLVTLMAGLGMLVWSVISAVAGLI